MATKEHNLEVLQLWVTLKDARELRRCALQLHRWFEHECNGTIQRDENGVAQSVRFAQNQYVYTPCPDKEKAAMDCISRVMARYPGLRTYVQGDPRGASLYIIRPGDVPDGASLDSYYYRGIAVY